MTLIEKLKKASEPDRELDREIELLTFPDRVAPCPTVELLAYTATPAIALCIAALRAKGVE